MHQSFSPHSWRLRFCPALGPTLGPALGPDSRTHLRFEAKPLLIKIRLRVVVPLAPLVNLDQMILGRNVRAHLGLVGGNLERLDAVEGHCPPPFEGFRC